MATDEKNNNANPPANGGDKKQNAEIEELKTAKQQLLQSNQQLQGQIDDLKGMVISPQYQEFMQTRNRPTQYSPSQFAAGREEMDLESMDRAQLVKYIMDNVSHTIASTISPQISKLSTDMLKGQLTDSIKDARNKYKDFGNYVTQMSQTSARIERSGITAEDVYKIATHPGPAAPETVKDKTEPPTSGAGGSLSAIGKEDSLKQIADKTYDKIFGNKG